MAAYAAFGAGDIDGVLSNMTPDMTWNFDKVYAASGFAQSGNAAAVCDRDLCGAERWLRHTLC